MVSLTGGFVLFTQFLSLRELFYDWEVAGIFEILLPFLLVFAVIYAILANTRILGDHRGVNIIISIVIGVLVTRSPQVSAFIQVLLANFGIALVALVVVIVLLGLFIGNKNRAPMMKSLAAVGGVGAAIVIIATINQFYWFDSPWWQNNWISLLWVIIIVVLIITVINWKDKSEEWEELGPVRKEMFTKR